ncbi:hypothetical protein PU634_04930 [Oceanimonas pelagia]|uniref:Uncharacterized protein n=1 Tax=Oceanimonas pelagia TaxID=3028314 RepID=A0AA50QD15_9GAMM|nr:hypothetical protein [Oceanimonas pelagia]WMC11711.1 hypothetical protein PU634_04930 [Oceanimonas pelagia]
MSKYRKGKLYIRRMKPTDKSDSFFTAMDMAVNQMICQTHKRKPPMVLVRHGFKRASVMTAGYSRRQVERRLLGRGTGPKQGGNRFKRMARSWKVKEAA